MSQNPGPEQSTPQTTDSAQATGAEQSGDGAPYSTGRPVHFEIQAGDLSRAVDFYTTVFGWRTEDYSEYAGMPYFGVTTGEGPGIDGAILGRPGGQNPEVGGSVAGAALTIGVADYDAAAEKILAAGGTEALPKYALPGMAWQGYFHDTENNVFGIHQPDPEAR